MSEGRGGPQFIPRPPGARPGDPAPWAELPADRLRLTVDEVRRAFAVLDSPARPALREQQGRPSAVLAPLYDDGGEAWVVLTRRSNHLRTHKGEVSFPGGGRDPSDRDLIATALRETQEEIGIDPATVEIIGELDHMTTFSGRAYIVPYVGALPGRPALVVNPHEVESIVEAPLSELLLAEVYREEQWGIDWPVHFFELVGDTVWGATGRMLRQLLGIVTGTMGRGSELPG